MHYFGIFCLISKYPKNVGTMCIEMFETCECYLLMPYNFIGLNNILKIFFYHTCNNKIKHYKWKSSSHIHMHVNVYIQCRHMQMVKHLNIYDIVSYISNIQMCTNHDIMCIWSYKIYVSYHLGVLIEWMYLWCKSIGKHHHEPFFFKIKRNKY